MRYISKNPSPDNFQKWLASATEEWQPNYANLRKPQKPELHTSLLAEQSWTCCYCGQSITTEISHIEHFRPQQKNPELELDYSNLLTSCGRDFEPGAPAHCGHAKDKNFDERLYLSPLDENCEARFLYTLDGQICEAEPNDENAKYMVGLLKLDIPFLRNRREEVIKRVFDEEFLLTATDDLLLELSRYFRTPDDEGKAQDLGHVVARFAEQQLIIQK